MNVMSVTVCHDVITDAKSPRMTSMPTTDSTEMLSRCVCCALLLGIRLLWARTSAVWLHCWCSDTIPDVVQVLL
jgi:hypothetical protein